MRQIFALTSVILATEFAEQYSEEQLFQTLRMVAQKTGVKFDKADSNYKLTGLWLSILEAYDILLDVLLTQDVTCILKDKEPDDALYHEDKHSLSAPRLDQALIEPNKLTSLPPHRTSPELINTDHIKVENDNMILVDSLDCSNRYLGKNSEQSISEINHSDELYFKESSEGNQRMMGEGTGKHSERKSLMLMGKEKHTNRRKTVKLTVKKKRGRKKKIRDEDEVFKCIECDYVGKTLYHLNNHKKRLHDIGNRYKCDQCNKSYGVNADLTRHKKLVHETPLFHCETCNKSYKSKAGYDEHTKSHQDDYVKPVFNCLMCEKAYSSKLGLAHHVKGDHLGMKNCYLCSICGQSFTSKTAYVGHANLHAGLKPHSCETCGKKFAFQKSLWEHSRTHDKICRYSCEVCGKMFKQNQSLKVHKKTHDDIRDHSCSICGKAFTQKQALNRHERIHSGALPFECLLCGKRFYDTSIIRRHMIFIHKSESSKWRDNIMTHIAVKKDSPKADEITESLSQDYPLH